MKRFLILFSFLWAILPCHASWKSLFNGQNLDKWSGDPRLWRVEGGILIGETNDTDRKIDKNSFLIWQGDEPGDFELEFQARVSSSNNSGVQYRSRVLDPATWVVAGYQMDLHPKAGYLGMLYEEQGRGIACERGQRVKLSDKPTVTGTLEVPEVDLTVWNSYRIVAQGFTFRHFINGKLAAEIQDTQQEKRSSKGVLALQLHAGAAMKAEFKDLRIRSGNKNDSDGKASAVWIWKNSKAEDHEKVYFRRQFQLPPKVSEASITLICDDSHELFVNGQKVGAAGGWDSPRHYNVLEYLKPGGSNLIAVQAVNVLGNAGLVLRFQAKLEDGKKLHIVSDENWKCNSEASEGWQNLDFPGAASWPKAARVAKMGDAPWGAIMPPESN